MTEPQEIFLKGTHGVGRQDKYAPGRVYVASGQPVPPDSPARTNHESRESTDKHHGSNKRQTEQIAAWVKPHIKSAVERIEKLNGWTQSKAVGTLVEQALAKNLGEQFAVMIRNTIQEAIKTELQKDREWLRKINLSEYLAAEQARLHAIDLHRLFIPPEQDINQKIKENRENSYQHLKVYFHSIGVMQEQWPSSK